MTSSKKWKKTETVVRKTESLNGKKNKQKTLNIKFAYIFVLEKYNQKMDGKQTKIHKLNYRKHHTGMQTTLYTK